MVFLAKDSVLAAFTHAYQSCEQSLETHLRPGKNDTWLGETFFPRTEKKGECCCQYKVEHPCRKVHFRGRSSA